jgi:hypothetical protein
MPPAALPAMQRHGRETSDKDKSCRKPRLFAAIALCGVAAAPFASLAAGADTFANGQSYYGQLTSPQAVTRVVDLGSASRINVADGESVTFRNGGQLFTWTCNGLYRRAVEVTKTATAGFPTEPLVVHVGLNPANRR